MIDTINQKVSNSNQYDTIKSFDTNKIRETTSELKALPNALLSKMTLISSGQLTPYTNIKINDCNFDFVTSDSDTIYLATKDKRFQTPEGYKVGSRLLELPKAIQSELIKEPGWGYYYKLPSGWTLGFCEGSSCTDNYPQKSSKVKWIFKR